MLTTYDEYVKQPLHLDIQDMCRLQMDMSAEIGEDEDALEIYEELMQTAVKYAGIRGRWLLLSREEKMDQDPGRTSCHNSMIIKFNMLARYLRMQGKAAAWRDELGDTEENPSARKTIGDFACYLVFINSLNAR